MENPVPDCPYCDESLSIVKGGSQVNGLHGQCAEEVNEEMEAAYGPVELVIE